MKLETAGNIAMLAIGHKKNQIDPALATVLPSTVGDFSSKSTTTQSSQASRDTDTKVSITFLGVNITSRSGLKMFKTMSILVPLMPTIILCLYNGFQLEGLLKRSDILKENYKQLQNAIAMSVLVSALQDERFNMAFLTLSNKEGQIFNIRFETVLSSFFSAKMYFLQFFNFQRGKDRFLQ